MFKKDDVIVFKRDVCIVKDIKDMGKRKCYVLSPTLDDSLTITIPVDNINIRSLLSKKEVEAVINNINNIGIIDSPNRLIENEYKDLLHSGKHEDLVKIIKTTYLRNKERADNKRTVGEKDKEYFNKAEKYLYNEFSYVLGKSYEDTKKYVIDKVNKDDKTK